MNPTQQIALSFGLIILLGTALLCLPAATRGGQPTGVLDSLFTATSATCVTGLVVYDTFTHWTVFGQIVILSLIQIGGLGFLTMMTMVAIFFRRRIGLQDRKMLMQAAGTLNLADVVRLIRQIAYETLACELAGAVALATQFIPAFGWKWGGYFSVFHSVSAFCNAGFDLMGIRAPGTSLIGFAGNPVVNITIMVLIVTGGLGFVVWSDIFHCRFRPGRMAFHTKLVLSSTAVLIFGGAALFLALEYRHTLAGMPLGEKVLASLFQSVTPRTAGFNTVDMGALSSSGNALITVLMFIGGSPGSTAGGIKTTTLAVLVLGAIASTRHRQETAVFRSRIDEATISLASSVATVYIFLIFFSSLVIGAFEPFPLHQIVFEVVSAIGTVGLTTGITPALGAVSKVILVLLMYCGRIGGLTFMLLFSGQRSSASLTHPAAKVLIG